MSQESSSSSHGFHSAHSAERDDEYTEDEEETPVSTASTRDIWSDMVNADAVPLPRRINFPATAVDKTTPTSIAVAEGDPSDMDVYTFYRVQPILKSELTGFLGWDSSSSSCRIDRCSKVNLRPFLQHMLGNGLLRQTIHPILPVLNADDGTPTNILTLKLELAAALQCGACPVHPINEEGMPAVVGSKGLATRFGGSVLESKHSNNNTTTTTTASSTQLNSETSPAGEHADDTSSSSPSYIGEVFSLKYDSELAQAGITEQSVTHEGKDIIGSSTAIPTQQSEGAATLPKIPRPPSSTGTNRPALRRPLNTAKKDGEFVDGNVAHSEEDTVVNPSAASSVGNELFIVIHSNADHLASLPRNSRLYVLINDCC